MPRLINNLEPMAREVGDLFKGMLSVLLPPLCVSCMKRLDFREKWLCRKCRSIISSSARPRQRLIRLGTGRNLIVRYALKYTAKVSGIITEMKYGDKPGLAGFFSPLLRFALGDSLPKDTVIVPVPMHSSRKRERGYNQSETLSRELMQLMDLPIRADLLVKWRKTPSQTALEKVERIGNVVDSVHVRPGVLLRSRRILLVDDVVTTGSTLKECARAVLDHHVEEVSACVLASS